MSDGDDVRLKPACLHLRHKMMYVDDRHRTIGMVDDSSDTRVFYCMRSQDALGPDGEPVSPDDCGVSRACYCDARRAGRP